MFLSAIYCLFIWVHISHSTCNSDHDNKHKSTVFYHWPPHRYYSMGASDNWPIYKKKTSPSGHHDLHQFISVRKSINGGRNKFQELSGQFTVEPDQCRRHQNRHHSIRRKDKKRATCKRDSAA